MFSHSWPQMWVTAGTTGLDTSYVDAGELIDIIYEPITWLTLIQNDMLWSAFRCGRWHSRHDCHDGRKVLIRNQRMREEPDIDERWARTAASSGHRPAGVRITRHQRAAVFFIDDDATHTYKHRYTQRLWSDVSHTHTHSRLTQSLKSLVLCCYQKKKKSRWHHSVCSKNQKVRRKKLEHYLQVFSYSVSYSGWRTFNTGEPAQFTYFQQ